MGCKLNMPILLNKNMLVEANFSSIRKITFTKKTLLYGNNFSIRTNFLIDEITLFAALSCFAS
jgi:hypothetical protein